MNDKFTIDKFVKDGFNRRTATMLNFMSYGDLKPLAAKILRGEELHPAVLNLLARMILGEAEYYRIETVPRRRGRPPKDNSSRDNLLSWGYERGKSEMGSDELLKFLANTTGVSVQTIKQAVTAHRKYKRSQSGAK